MNHASTEWKSGMFPSTGELWDCQGRLAVICGNSFDENGRIWIMEWSTGLQGNAKPQHLTLRDDRKSLTEAALVERFSEWARDGNPAAMWWLAWWFEGKNHHKSVWYYVAALRADPEGHGWAQERIMSDARSACMCEGVPDPDTTFVEQIPELRGARIGPDWNSAVIEAEKAVHIPAKKQIKNRRVIRISHTAPAFKGNNA